MLNGVPLYWKALLCIARRSCVLKGASRTVPHGMLRVLYIALLCIDRPAARLDRRKRSDERREFRRFAFFAELSLPEHRCFCVEHLLVRKGRSPAELFRVPGTRSSPTPQNQRKQRPNPAIPRSLRLLRICYGKADLQGKPAFPMFISMLVHLLTVGEANTSYCFLERSRYID